MKPCHAVLAAAVLIAPLAAGAADVGISLNFSQPGMYGRIDIGQFPQPQVVLAQPILVAPPPPAGPPPEPVYLWVPPGHRKHWEKHCGEYHACGRPVYFVKDDWYQHNVMEHGRHGDEGGHKDHGDHGDHGKGHGHGHDD
jgi:DNA-binding transcriptional LysR family regulator